VGDAEAVTSLGLQARIGVNTGEVVAGEGDTLVTAECEYARGDFHEAARIYRQVYDKLGELGEHGFRSTVGIELGEALYELGERDEPERLALDAETMGGPDDLVNFAFGRALRARIAADRGELEAA
jgi:class 3 adenylate cyclase